jgi:hypothetical protein
MQCRNTCECVGVSEAGCDVLQGGEEGQCALGAGDLGGVCGSVFGGVWLWVGVWQCVW